MSDTAHDAPQARDGAAGDPPSAAPAGTPGARGADTPVDLAARDREILAFERQWWRFAGAKEAAIRESFQMSPTRYYQVLNALVDRPDALAADPLLVRRLRRLRRARQRTRSSQGSVQ